MSKTYNENSIDVLEGLEPVRLRPAMYIGNVAIEGLQAFIDAYRSVHPYDSSGTNHAARLTIDLAAGGRYLQDLNRHATIHWLDNENPVLDYANAMVHRSSGTPAHWQEHVDGKPTYDPVIPPRLPIDSLVAST